MYAMHVRYMYILIHKDSMWYAIVYGVFLQFRCQCVVCSCSVYDVVGVVCSMHLSMVCLCGECVCMHACTHVCVYEVGAESPAPTRQFRQPVVLKETLKVPSSLGHAVYFISIHRHTHHHTPKLDHLSLSHDLCEVASLAATLPQSQGESESVITQKAAKYFWAFCDQVHQDK